MNYLKKIMPLNLNDKKSIFVFLPFLIVLTIILPFIVLSFFAQPNAEDFSLSFTSRETNPFYSVLTLYQNGDGRLFTNFLYAINPLVFNFLWGYKLIPVLLIILFLFVLGYFVKIVTQVVDFKLFIFYISIVTVVFLSHLPSLPHAFYWMASSFNYTVSVLALVIFISRLVDQTFTNKLNKTGVVSIIVNVLLIYVIICSNEIYILFMLIGLITVTVIAFYRNNGNRFLYLTYLICAVSASLIPVLPQLILKDVSVIGFQINYIDFAGALIQSTMTAAANVIDWSLFNAPLLLTTVLMIALKDSIGIENKFFTFMKSKYILIIGFFVFLFLITTLLPYFLFREKSHVPQRIFNVQYLIFTLYWFTGVLFLIKRTKRIWKADKKISFLLVLALVFTVSASHNIRLLYSDMFSGKVYRYNKEMQNRFITLGKDINNKSLRKVAVIQALKNRPSTIYFPPDILPDRAFPLWNKAYERYFGFDEVRFENDTLKLYD